MSTMSVATQVSLAPVLDPRLERSKTDVRRFAMLAIPLALLLLTFRAYNLEQPAFFRLACVVFGGFAVSYWLPFRYKEPFLILLSLTGAYLLLSPVIASLLIAAGLGLFGIIRSRLDFRSRVLVLAGILCVLIYGRATGRFHVPGDFWPVLGSIFMFRMVIYLYDLKH